METVLIVKITGRRFDMMKTDPAAGYYWMRP